MTGSVELALAASFASESTSQKPRQLSGISIVSFCHLKQKSLRFPVASDMLKKKLIEVCDQTSWGKLDFLLIDLPSGNMDLALFIEKNLPACQFLLVTTPAAPAIAAPQSTNSDNTRWII